MLEKALKRKIAQSGDHETAGPSTSKTKWTHEDLDTVQQEVGIADGKVNLALMNQLCGRCRLLLSISTCQSITS